MTPDSRPPLDDDVAALRRLTDQLVPAAALDVDALRGARMRAAAHRALTCSAPRHLRDRLETTLYVAVAASFLVWGVLAAAVPYR